MMKGTDSSFFSFLLIVLTFPLICCCPPNCECYLDDSGRIKVSCARGGLTGPLDVTGFEPKIEVLEITAPEHNLNSLMIGPIFDKFIKLEEIYLEHSNIPEIGSHSFWRLPSLRSLSLRDNNITTVLDNNFRGLANLQKLYLDENRIDHLTSGSFKYLINLRVLSLTNNRLSELVTRAFEKLLKLQELNLSGNSFYKLNPEVFVDIKELKVFECRSCGLIDIDSRIYQLVPELTTLDLGDNSLIYPGNLSSLSYLQSLWLDRNALSSLPIDTFANQLELIELNLGRNTLTKLPQRIFSNLTKLNSLDLSYNNLENLDAELFQSFASILQRLNLSGNNLRPSIIAALTRTMRHLLHLGLSEMQLSELPLGLFDYNKELLSLDFSRNHFLHLPLGVLSPVARLHSFDFSFNYLYGLDEKSLLRLETISEIRLDRNRWACDLCHIQPILIAMNRSTYLRSLKCRTPRSLHNRLIGTLQMDDLKMCSTNELLYEDEDAIYGNYFLKEGRLGAIAAGAGLLLLTLTLVALLAGVCYSRRHAANYYTHEEKRTGMENDPIFENNSDILFGDNGEISFKFPMDKKISIATIDEMRKIPEIPTKGS